MPASWPAVLAAAHATTSVLPALTVPVEAALGFVLAHPLAADGTAIRLEAGTVVTPWVAGLAAERGLAELAVRVRPAVGLLVADDSGWQLGADAGAAGQGPLGTALPGLVRAAGGEPGPVSWLPDDAVALGMAVEMVASDTAACDVLVVVRVPGDPDPLREVLIDSGGTLVLDGVAVQPGGASLLAALPGGRLVVGLGSTPADVAVGIVTVLGPVLAGLTGHPTGVGHQEQVALGIAGTPGRTTFVPAHRGPDGLRPVPVEDWGIAAAQAFIAVPPDGVGAGEAADVVELPGAGQY